MNIALSPKPLGLVVFRLPWRQRAPRCAGAAVVCQVGFIPGDEVLRVTRALPDRWQPVGGHSGFARPVWVGEEPGLDHRRREVEGRLRPERLLNLSREPWIALPERLQMPQSCVPEHAAFEGAGRVGAAKSSRS